MKKINRNDMEIEDVTFLRMKICHRDYTYTNGWM